MGTKASERTKVAVVGDGSWGLALAVHLERRGCDVALWGRNPQRLAAMASERKSPRYLPEVVLGPGITPTANLQQALSHADLLVCAVPSHAVRETLAAVAPHVRDKPILLACKGIELDSLATMHEAARAALGAPDLDQVAVLGGPSFAAEVADGLPTVVVVASDDPAPRLAFQDLLSGDGVRAYDTDDVIGVELGGALKNVIALAAGMCDGAGLGLNARAALMTRGLAEIGRLASAMGADPATLAGLAGMGDLVLTCTGGLSRNRRVGLALGEGKTLEQALDEVGMVAEGVKTTRSAHALAQREGVEMPIVATMYQILYGSLTVADAVEGLMGRRLRSERD